jgi:hypothetical protein
MRCHRWNRSLTSQDHSSTIGQFNRGSNRRPASREVATPNHNGAVNLNDLTVTATSDGDLPKDLSTNWSPSGGQQQQGSSWAAGPAVAPVSGGSEVKVLGDSLLDWSPVAATDSRAPAQSHGEQSFEEFPVAGECDPQVFGGRFFAATPLVFQARTCLGEPRRKSCHDVGDETVGLLDARSGIVDESGLDFVPSRT